jgi:hypothetical protein
MRGVDWLRRRANTDNRRCFQNSEAAMELGMAAEAVRLFLFPLTAAHRVAVQRGERQNLGHELLHSFVLFSPYSADSTGST